MNVMKNTGYSLSLYGLYWALRAASWWPAFRRMLSENDFTLVIKTTDNAVSRLFTIRAGKIVSRKGNVSSPDLCVSWSSADACFKALSRAAAQAKPEAVFDSIMTGDLSIEGDAKLAYWFMQTVIKMAGVLPLELIYQWRKA